MILVLISWEVGGERTIVVLIEDAVDGCRDLMVDFGVNNWSDGTGIEKSKFSRLRISISLNDEVSLSIIGHRRLRAGVWDGE